jgi:Kdo2-lipid IVA lauroyltransferase/acyltransferase
VRSALLRAGEWLGALAWLLGIRRAVALDGLRRAFPALSGEERRKIGRASYRQLGRSLAEVILPPRDEDLERAVRFEGWEIYQAAQAQGRGVVCAVAHFGNFELLARVAARRGMKLSIIVRNLGDAFGRWLFESRMRTGVRHLPDQGSSKDAIAVLRRNEVLAIAVDQNMRPSRGIFVDFFGDPACTTPAAAVFALRSGAPIIAAFPIRQADGTHLVRIRGPFATRLSGRAAVEDLTRQITFAVENEVREHPDHWFWVHRRWKTREET